MPGDEDKPDQLTASDVDRMFAARQYDDIEAARQAGRLDDLLSGAQQQRRATERDTR